MREIIVLFLLLIVLVGVFFVMSVQQKEDKEYIQNWANVNDHKILEVNATLIDCGPFWIRNKHERIYRVTFVDTPRVSYFKFGVFGQEQRWQN